MQTKVSYVERSQTPLGTLNIQWPHAAFPQLPAAGGEDIKGEADCDSKPDGGTPTPPAQVRVPLLTSD